MARRRKSGKVSKQFTQPAGATPPAAPNSEIWGAQTYWYNFERNLAPGVNLRGRSPLGPAMVLRDVYGGPIGSRLGDSGSEVDPGRPIVTPSKQKRGG